MSWKIAAAGIAGAVALGLLLGGQMRPALASRSDEAIDPFATSDAGAGPIDLTPAYVSPVSLQAWRAATTAPSVPLDPIDGQVRRDLAQSDVDLRASEAALEDYRRAAVVVSGAAAAADRIAAAFTPDPGAAAAPPASADAPSTRRVEAAEFAPLAYAGDDRLR